MLHSLTKYPFVLLAALSTIVAGVLHATLVAFAHITVPPEFWFFLITGSLQIIWGLNFLYRRTPNMYFVGAVLNLGLTFFWLFVRLFPAPFSDTPESIQLLGIVTAIIQLIAFAASFWALYRFHKTTMFSILALIVVSLAMADIGYMAAKGSEGLLLKIWPEMADTPHGHGAEATEDNHDEDEENESEPDHDDSEEEPGHID